MIRNAKVSLVAVKTFEQAVSAVKDYSVKFDRGISGLDGFSQYITKQIGGVNESCSKLQQSQAKLRDKAKKLKITIVKLNERMNKLEACLASLESELSSVPEFISITNESDEVHEIPNPEYVSLREDIDDVEEKIEAVAMEKALYHERLNKVNAVDAQIEKQIDKFDSVVHALEEKKSSCHKLREELLEIKAHNFKNGENAFEKLKKIEEIIAAYQRKK